MPANKRKIINDPVFGFTTLPDEFIYDLLQQPCVHRLTRIKQLGLTSYVYPGTQHTRFQHSLGALSLMIEAIKTLREKGQDITDEEADGVYAAILLHDIGHGPFSHTLEHFFFPKHTHEEVGLAIIEQLNQKFEGKLDLTLQILRNSYHKHYLHELVSGQLDMDRLDYLRRDSFFSGVSEGNIGSARIIKMLNVHNDKLVVEAKGIYSIENFLMSRRLMYWQVYLHKTVYASDQMVLKTMQRARYVAMRDASALPAGPLQYFLLNDNIPLNTETLNLFLQLDDSDIWVALKQWMHHRDKVLSLLSQGIVERNLFHLQISSTPFDQAYVEQKRSELVKALSITCEDVDFLMSNSLVANHIYSKNETAIDILYSDGSTKNITEASDLLTNELLSQRIAKYYFSYYRIKE